MPRGCQCCPQQETSTEGCRVIEHDYFTTASALQVHEANVVRAYRRDLAEKYRQLAAETEAKALEQPDVTEQELLVREAATWRWAAAIADVVDE